MKTFLSLIAGVTLMTAVPSYAQSCCNKSEAGQISVSGTGQSFHAPDVVTVKAGVVTQADNPTEAISANAALMSAALTELRRAGILEKHIQTSQFTLQPRYDYKDQTRIIIGYDVSNMVTAQSEDLTNSGKMIDALVRAGVNDINSISFSLKDPEQAQSEARRAAIKSARAKAEEMAQAAGVKLGKIIMLSEAGAQNYAPTPMLRAASAPAKATPIAAGEQTISVTVNITYALEQ